MSSKSLTELFSLPTWRLFNEAFSIRQENFGWDATLVFPRSTRAVSLTGRNCDQGCAHCNGRFLHSMDGLDSFLKRARRGEVEGVRSLLISGGFTGPMRLPILPFRQSLEELREMGFSLNFHTGLPDEETIDFLASAADAVSIDIVTSSRVLERVYNAPGFSGSEFLDAYLRLRGRTKTVPHLCIGLDGGKIGWEYEAIEKLSALGPAVLTLNILKPSKDTRFEGVDPPPLAEIARFLAIARILLPHTALSIGCMRPGGRYRFRADNIALLAGVNKLVNPVLPTIEFAARLGLNPVPWDACCSLDPS